MATSLIVIGVVVLGAAIAAVVWFLTGRRPPRLDPRSERLIESLTQLQRDNPRRATEVISRALVRAGLVWEKDLQTGGGTPQHTVRPPFSDHRRDQHQRPPNPRGDNRGDARGAQQQAGQRQEPRDQRSPEQRPPDQRPPSQAGTPSPRAEQAEGPQSEAAHASRRRRRRRPSGPREQRPAQQPGTQQQGDATPPPQEQA